jgi:hypothetical protein
MDLAARYLSLLKKSLLNTLYIENEARIVYLYTSYLSGTPIEDEVVRDIAGRRPEIVSYLVECRAAGRIGFRWDVPLPDGSRPMMDLRNVLEVYHTMIGQKRMDNIHDLLDRIVADRVDGDLCETGIWRGGATIFMRGYLAAHGIRDRKVWAADSFNGLPPPSHAEDEGFDYSKRVFPGIAISRKEVEDLFRRYDLLDDQVEFLEGWFRDTLPSAPIERLALLRLDGDLYESTMDALNALYARLSDGGFVIVDDYNDFAPCRKAVDEFRERHGVDGPLHEIDWSAVYWRKGAPATRGGREVVTAEEPRFNRKAPRVTVIENFYKNVDEVRALALRQPFDLHLSSYEGRRTERRFLFPGLKEELEQILRRRIVRWEEYPANGVFQIRWGGCRTVFRADDPSYAAAVYLNPGPPRGSGMRFYRSRATGLRTPPTAEDAERLGRSQADLLRETFQETALDPTAWDLVDDVGNVYNRLVLWDAKLIHSAGDAFGPEDPARCRLFQLFFFDVE